MNGPAPHRVEPTRTREQGRKVTLSANGADRIAACRDITARHSFAKIDGVMVDLFSANAIIAVYDALTAQNKSKFENLPIAKMAKVAFQFVK